MEHDPFGAVGAAPAGVTLASEAGARTMSFAQRLALAIVALELALLYVPTVQWLWTRWTMSVWHNAHGMFVPPIAVYLAWDELRHHRDLRGDRGSAWGFLFLAPALLLRALDAGMHTELLSAVSLVVALPGLSLLYLGRRRTAKIAFPLAFLLFAMPIPLGTTETAHLVLRHVTVAAAAWLLPLAGITTYVEGTTIHLANGALEVADACSGFSTVYAAMAVAVLTAYMCRSMGRRVLVLATAVPIAVLSNVVRVLVLIALVHWKGEQILETFLHPLSGMITFAVSLPLIFWIGTD